MYLLHASLPPLAEANAPEIEAKEATVMAKNFIVKDGFDCNGITKCE